MRIPIGDTLGKFTVLSIGTRNSWAQQVIARCACGTIKQVALPSLMSKGDNRTISCGCHRRALLLHQTHGHKSGGKESRTYKSWKSMMDRCKKEWSISFPRYGGNGIQVCERWERFENFLEDMGQRPEGTSLDRIDGTGDYTPANCRWATAKVQARNQSNNLFFTIDGATRCLAEWAEIYGMTYSAAIQRVRKGWSIERALTQPRRIRHRKQRLVEAAGLVRAKRLEPDDGN